MRKRTRYEFFLPWSWFLWKTMLIEPDEQQSSVFSPLLFWEELQVAFGACRYRNLEPSVISWPLGQHHSPLSLANDSWLFWPSRDHSRRNNLFCFSSQRLESLFSESALGRRAQVHLHRDQGNDRARLAGLSPLPCAGTSRYQHVSLIFFLNPCILWLLRLMLCI